MGLSFLKKQKGVEEENKDVLGGGAFLLNTGIYDGIIDVAYLDQSKGGAYSLNVIIKTADSKTVRETIWMTNKEGANTYTKGDKTNYLPGYILADNMALCAVGESISNLDPEDKILSIYNPELKKEAPTEKKVFMDLVGKPITVAVTKVKEFKNVKQADGSYTPGTDIREFNEISKVFNTETRQTVVEAKAEVEPAFEQEWVLKFPTEYVKDKTQGSNATKQDVKTTPSKSLFGAN